MEQEPVKCPHCEKETTFRTSERFKKTSPSELTTINQMGSVGIDVLAVHCKDCNTVIGTVDNATRSTMGSILFTLKSLIKTQ
jgi:hypothetical protein